jgi:N-acyl-D-amino-acid deacylase
MRWFAHALVLALPGSVFAQTAPVQQIPITGRADPQLKSFDELMLKFVKEHGVPGASLAVAKDGRLVYARGFGFADVEAKQAVQPEALFRIASISKPVTAVAVLHLVEQGKFKLTDKIFELLKFNPVVEQGQKPDPRLQQITVLDLLRHTSGWDRAVSFDPMFRPILIANAVGTPAPAGPEAVIRYMLGKPLDHPPGERYAYSNFGYCLLGRLIEKTTGMKYEAFVQKSILAPLDIRDMKLGRSLIEQRAKGEVKYYDEKNRTAAAVVGPKKMVPLPYGAWYLEAMDSHGGWIASAPDLVRFGSAFNIPEKCKVLKADSIQTMFARPSGLAGFDASKNPLAAYYGCGWWVRPVGTEGKANTWHTGSLDGTSTLLVRRHDGLCWAVLFNTRNNPKGQTLSGLIDPLVHQAADAVKTWPLGQAGTAKP